MLRILSMMILLFAFSSGMALAQEEASDPPAEAATEEPAPEEATDPPADEEAPAEEEPPPEEAPEEESAAEEVAEEKAEEVEEGDDSPLPTLSGEMKAYLEPDILLSDYNKGLIDIELLLSKIKRSHAVALKHFYIYPHLPGEDESRLERFLPGHVDYVLKDCTFNRLLSRLEEDKKVTVDMKSKPGAIQVKPYERKSVAGNFIQPFFVPDIALGDIITRHVDLVTQLRTWALVNKKRLAVDTRLRATHLAQFAQPDMKINEFLDTLIGLEMVAVQKVGNLVYVQGPDADIPWDDSIIYLPDNDQISFGLQAITLASFQREVREITGKTLIITPPVEDAMVLSGNLEYLPFDLGLQTLLEINGLQLRIASAEVEEGEVGGSVYYVERQPRKQGVRFNDGLFDVYFQDKPLSEVLNELNKYTHVPIVVTQKLEDVISIDVRDMEEQELLDLLVRDTRFTFIENDRAYVLGTEQTELITFTKVRADQVGKMLPESLTKDLTVESLPAINGMLIHGKPGLVSRLRTLALGLDRSIPQVLLEVTMVDFTDSLTNDINLSLFAGQYSLLGTGGVDISLEAAPDANGDIKVGRLPSNYTFNFKALESKGLAKVIQKPLVAAMSGEEAEIKVGETVYFKLTTEEIVGTDNPRVRTTEEIQSEDAFFSLKIRPYVIDKDLLTVEVEPSFDSFSGSVSNNVPPPKNVTSLKSTVHLRSGETIVLGGLIKNTVSLNSDGVPFLSRVPILGNLFKNRSKSKDLNETYIYIRPLIYYGEPGSRGYITDQSVLDPPLIDPASIKRKKKKRKKSAGS